MDWVNPKQARRILLMRAKKNKQILNKLATNQELPNDSTIKFSKPRKKKDATRSKLASERLRENGNFVSKERHEELKRVKLPKAKRTLLHQSDSETDDPDWFASAQYGLWYGDPTAYTF